MSALFVTGAGTEIGKTFIVTGLVRRLRRDGRAVHAIKPVVSGFRDIGGGDTAEILGALGLDPGPRNIAAISPWRFAAPLSPDMAAAREGRAIDFDALVRFSREAQYETGNEAGGEEGRDLLIEGIGGVMVPLTATETVLDWITALGFPTLLVAGSYLGALSHALTAALALASREVPLAAVIVDESADSPVPLAETAAVLARFLAPVPIVPVSRIAASQHSFEAGDDLLSVLGPK